MSEIVGAGYLLLQGDVRSVLPTLPERSIHTAICSPPYFALRSYLDASHPDKHLELGQEASPQAFVASLVAVFDRVKRVLRDDGTLWVNISDSYANGGVVDPYRRISSGKLMPQQGLGPAVAGTPAKSLHLIPQRFVIAMVEAGWICRQDLIWNKSNPMPSSATDRCTPAHEYIFLFSKKPSYYFDSVAIAEPSVTEGDLRAVSPDRTQILGRGGDTSRMRTGNPTGATRTRRSVWRISSEPLQDAHYAAFPTRLPELCLLAGTSAYGCCSACGAPWERVVGRDKHPTRDMESQRAVYAASPGRIDGHVAGPSGMVDRTFTKGWQPTCTCTAGVVPCTVLDPFTGSGSTAIAALRNGMQFVGCELSEEYVGIARRRIEASLHAGNVLDRPKVKVIEGQQTMFTEDEPPVLPVKDKQGASGLPTYVGFNSRWKAREGGAE